MTPASAGDIARDALIWLAARPDAVARFLAETGTDPAALRRLAADPGFLGGVLDFLLRDEALLCAFAAEQGLAPGDPALARAALPGGDLPHWT